MNFNYGSGLGPRKALSENTCIAGEISIDTKVSNMCLLQHHIFHGYRMFQHCYHMMSFESNDIVFEVDKYHSLPNNIPFRVGY